MFLELDLNIFRIQAMVGSWRNKSFGFDPKAKRKWMSGRARNIPFQLVTNQSNLFGSLLSWSASKKIFSMSEKKTLRGSQFCQSAEGAQSPRKLLDKGLIFTEGERERKRGKNSQKKSREIKKELLKTTTTIVSVKWCGENEKGIKLAR